VFAKAIRAGAVTMSVLPVSGGQWKTL